MEKRESFKFSMRTINNIQSLIDLGVARNKTEAIDFALEHIVTEETTKRAIKNQNVTYAQTRISTECPHPERVDMPLSLMNLISSERANTYI